MSGRGCHECGGIYTHQGMCSGLPAGSEAGRRRDAILALRQQPNARLLITGGRDYQDRDFVFRTLDELRQDLPIEVIIHGAATGADSLAAEWAIERGVEHLPFRAKWDDIDVPGAVIRFHTASKFGRHRRPTPYNAAAGTQRNAEMLRAGCPTHCIAFPGGRGTDDMVRRVQQAIRAGQAVELIDLRFSGSGIHVERERKAG